MNFLKTKAGGMTIAFLAIIVAFVVIMAGLRLENEGACLAGFLLILLAALYAPFYEFVLKRRSKNPYS